MKLNIEWEDELKIVGQAGLERIRGLENRSGTFEGRNGRWAF
jgi:hypothetical protein